MTDRTRGTLAKVPVWVWLAILVITDLVLALAVRVPSLLGAVSGGEIPQRLWALDVLMLTFVPVVILAAVRLTRLRRDEKLLVNRSSGEAQTMNRTSREWLWAVDGRGVITFSSPMCERLTGYKPHELTGSPISIVLDPADLAAIRRPREQTNNPGGFERVTVVCRHRDGSRVLLEASGQSILDEHNAPAGFEGMARAADVGGPGGQDAANFRKKLADVIAPNGLVTAFQPLWCLHTGALLGVEALSRFPAARETSPEAWFLQASAAGMGVELELLALTAALQAAAAVPDEIVVAVNLSPAACLDPRIRQTLLRGPLPPARLMLEITEREEVSDYAALESALAPLRAAGMQLAVDDAGAGFASLRHVLRLRPDIIKLDRSIVRNIEREKTHRALGAAMVGFAAEIGASVLAEGVETADELTAVKELGMDAVQGYHLGRPSTVPGDWRAWALPK